MTNRPIISLFLLALSALTAAAAVLPTKLNKDITWEITDDGILKVYGQGEIPDFKEDSRRAWHQDYRKLGLEYNFEIKSIEIGEGITSIGKNAFVSPVSNDDVLCRSRRDGNIIRISLPSTLLNIGEAAFENLPISNIILPQKLKIIGDNAFLSLDLRNILKRTFNLEIPGSVEFIGRSAFESVPISELVIHGNPIIGADAFNSSFYNPSVKENWSPLSSVVITGHPISNNSDPFAASVLKVRFGVFTFSSPRDKFNVYLEDKNYDYTELKLDKYAVIIYGSPEDDKNVKSYVANRVPSWEKFLDAKVADGKILSTEGAKADIEKKLTEWQTKGEFETTADWQKRVTEKTRKKYLDGLIANRNKDIDAVKNEYNNLRKKYADEFYSDLIKPKKDKMLSDNFTLEQYDADNQTYLIKTSHNGDILLKVPRDKAKKFKEEWPNIVADKRIYITPHFIPDGDNSVALKKIEFGPIGPDVFVYDGSAAQYAVTDINYNFAPLEIEDIDASSFSSPFVAEAPVTKTVGGPAISKRKVDVAHNSASVGDGASAKTSPAKRSDVDINIPKAAGSRPNTFALVIANENYRRVAAVPFAANDGKVVCEYLKTTLGLPEKNIIYVEDASLNDLNYNLQRIAEICRAYKGDASLIVYYAGHGVPDDSTKDAYLLPVDGYAESPSASGLSLSALTATLADLPTKSTSLFLDACFSGGVRSGDASDMLVGARGVRIKPKRNAVSGNLVLFSASQGEETAQPYDEKQHGLFTYYLLKKLQDSKGSVTLGDLTDYVTDSVERTSVVNGKKQTPTVTASPDNPAWRTTDL